MPKQHEQLTTKSFKSTFLNPEKVKEKGKVYVKWKKRCDTLPWQALFVCFLLV